MSGYIGSKSSVTQVDGYNRTEADAEFVAKSGDTMTGPLSVTGTVTADGLTVDGTPIRFNSTAPMLYFMETGVADSNHRIRQNAGNLYFQKLSDDEATATDRMLIDGGTGNVGIGKSPATRLNVEGDWVSNTGQLCVDGASGQTYTGMSIRNNGTSESLWYHDNNLNTVNLYTFSDPLVFWTGVIERMRIKSNGSVDIGGFATTGTADGVQINGDGAGVQSKAATTGFSYHNRFYNSNGQVGYISTQTSATQYNTSSDYRLKTDAQPMVGASARVQALNPVNFEWIADGTRVDGFLAHEAQAVVPEAVTGTKDAMMDEEYEVTPAVYEDVVIEAVLDDEGNELEAERTEQNLVTEAVMGTRNVPDYQGIDQSKLVPLLTAALQEALNKIDTMETRLAALEGN